MRAALFLLLTASTMAASGPENIAVVVNGDSWASLTVANAYRNARQIPSGNFILLRDIPSFEQVPVATFREKILLPALQEVERRGLAPQLDYLVYSSDFPTAIDVTADMAGKEFPKQITQPASLNGLSFFYQFVLAKNPGYLGLNTNFYYRQPSQSRPEEPVSDPARYAAAMQRFMGLNKPSEHPKELGEIRSELQAINQASPERPEVLFNLARVEGRLGELDAAMTTLKKAIVNGWWDMQLVQLDGSFRSMLERPDFKELVELGKKAKFDLAPTSGFRGNVGWQPNGRIVLPNQGVRYLLSTMLGCTSGRGMSVPEVVANLQRSAKADGTRPQGTVYLMENGGVRSKTRDWAFPRTVEKLKEIGVEARIEHGLLPSQKADVMGLTTGVDSFSWKESGSTILPGAICEHLTSFGGMLGERDGQTPLVEFLRNGAAGASGTVGEPYALQGKFPTAFVHYHYAQGCTLAEAFYQSIPGPYQLLIVGDPLCAPWKKQFKVTLPLWDPNQGLHLTGPVKLVPAAESADGIKLSHFEVFLDGRRIAIAKPEPSIAFDSAALPDGAHDLQFVAVGDDALGSTGQLDVPCVVKNGENAVVSEIKTPAKIRWDTPMKIAVKAPGAKRVCLRQMGREVGSVESESGEISLDPRILGQGQMQLVPVGIWEGGREVWGDPISFEVAPATPLSAQRPPRDKILMRGFTVEPAGGRPVVIQKNDGDWLAEAGVKEGFALEGWFSVDADDVFQFQLRGPTALKIIVDDVPQDWPRGKEWWFVPMSLGKGLHKVRIEGRADGAPLDVRFGGPGSYRLSGERFQHLE